MPCEIWSYLKLRDRTARRILSWETEGEKESQSVHSYKKTIHMPPQVDSAYPFASQVTGKDGWGKENMTGRDVQGEGGSTQDAVSKKEQQNRMSERSSTRVKMMASKKGGAAHGEVWKLEKRWNSLYQSEPKNKARPAKSARLR